MEKKKNTNIEKEQPCRKTKTIKVLHSCSCMELPKISMEGKWLEELGFQIGDRLHVKYGSRYICISHAADIHQPLAVCEPDTAYAAGMAYSEVSGREDLKTKHIKVAASMHARKKMTGWGQGFYYPEHSRISMEGKWLEKAGFLTGSRIQVDYQENFICIYPAV